MRRRQTMHVFVFQVILVSFISHVAARLAPLSNALPMDRALHRRQFGSQSSGIDISTPLGQAQWMQQCLTPQRRFYADTIQDLFSKHPARDIKEQDLLSVNPKSWGFAGFGHDHINNWNQDGKNPKQKKRTLADKDKLTQCANSLRSLVNQAASGVGGSGSGAAGGGGQQFSMNGAEIGNPATQNGTKSGDSQPGTQTSTDSKVKAAPGVGPDPNAVKPTLDLENKLLPQPATNDSTTTVDTQGNPKSANNPSTQKLDAVSLATVPGSNPGSDPTASPGSSSGSSSGSGSGTCAKITQRKEYSTLSDAEKQSFVDALKCLRQNPTRFDNNRQMNAFDDFALFHMRMLKYVHFTAYFLPFHRAVLAMMERDLQACGFQGGLPWIDWTKNADDGSQSPIWNSNPVWGLGTNGQGSNQQCPYGEGHQVMDGAWAGLVFNVPSRHVLCRDFNNMDTARPNPNWGTNCTTFMNANFVDGILASHSDGKFFDFASTLEISTHMAVHTCVGGGLPWLSTSPNDPVFWTHHAFLDQVYWKWQNLSPANKLAFQGPKLQNKDGAWNPWDASADDVINLQPLADNVKVSDMFDTQGAALNGQLCYEYTS